MLTIIVLALGGVVVWKVMMVGGVGAKRLECAACDLYITGARPSEGEAVVCPHCRAFSLFQQGTLVAVPAGYIAPQPIFCAELPLEGTRWQTQCCACDEPATRVVPIQLTYTQDASFGTDIATRAATLGMFKAVTNTTVSLEVPHCAQHADGAKLTMPYEREQSNFGIAFRSSAAFAQFVALNHATPRKASMFAGEPQR